MLDEKYRYKRERIKNMSTQQDGWIRLKDPIRTDPITDKPVPLTQRQENAIRSYFFHEYGKESLRGAHMILRKRDWTYYNVLRAESP